MPKRSILACRPLRAKSRGGHTAVIQQSIFDSSQTDGRELIDSPAVPRVSLSFVEFLCSYVQKRQTATVLRETENTCTRRYILSVRVQFLFMVITCE